MGETLDQLLADLHKAENWFKEAREGEREARSTATNAKNALNSAQKAFDKAVEEIKSDPARDTEWWDHRHAP